MRGVRIVRNGLACILLGIAIWIGVEVALVVRSVNARVTELQPIITGDRNSLKTTISNANDAAFQLGVAADIWTQASATQKAELEKQSEKVTALLGEASELVKQGKDTLAHFDENVSGKDGLLRAATAMIKNQDENATLALRESVWAVRQMTNDLHDTSARLEPTMASLAEAMDGVSKAVNDPKVQSTMTAVDGTAKNVEKSSAHIEKALRPAKIWMTALQAGWKKVVEIFTAW